MRTFATFLLLIVSIAACFFELQTPAAFAQADRDEASLAEVLRSDASLAEKSAACRQLARIGTKRSVPVLASLLLDERLSHMARYALERIPDRSADEALREALGRASGRVRLGIIASLGVRRDAEAVQQLTVLLGDRDPATASTAARALGDIATPAAAESLLRALGQVGQKADRINDGVHEGLLRAAEALSRENNIGLARTIYDRLRNLSAAPDQVRTAAWRGAIMLSEEKSIDLLTEALSSEDQAVLHAGMRAALELSGPKIADVLIAEMKRAPSERRGLLIELAAARGEPRVLPAVAEAAQSDDGRLRLAALRALKRIGNASVLPVLLDAAINGKSEESQAAIEALTVLPDKELDRQIVARLGDATGRLRAVLLDLARRRGIGESVQAFWRAVDDPELKIRLVGWAGLGTVAETNDLPKLIGRMADAKDQQEVAAIELAVREVCLRAADRDSAVRQVAAALGSAPSAIKVKLLEILNILGGDEALRTVAAAARSSDTELRDAAYRTLGQWRSVEVAPLLLELHREATDERLKIRAIRAYIRVARQFDMLPTVRAEMCRKALETASRDEDKRLVLEVVLRYPTDEMRPIAEEAAKSPALKDEAELILTALSQAGNVDRAELGKALAQAGHQPVQLEIIRAVYGAGDKFKDVTEALKKYAKNYRIIFVPGGSYNAAFGGDPAPGVVKQLKVRYRINGKEGEAVLNENSPIVLPIPK